jgi:hypothetical protein
VGICAPLVAHHEPPVLGQPRQCPLDDPPVPPQPLTGVFSSPRDAILDAASAQNCSAAREVVALVRVQLLGPLARSASAASLYGPDSVNRLLEDPRVMDVRAGKDNRQRYARALRHQVALGA